MKSTTKKKHIAFIIAFMMFSAMPALVNAQPKPKKCHNCPPKCDCFMGFCICLWPSFLSPPSNEATPISNANSNALSFQLEEAQNVSGKIYDATGRLVRSIVYSKMSEGYHEVEWDSKDETGKKAPEGIYVLKMNAKNYTDTKKILIVK